MRSLIASLVLTSMIAACTTTGTTSSAEVADPWEGMNRHMFNFNNGLDRYAVAPAANVYGAIVPEFLRDRVNDFTSNMIEPATFANDVLQGEGQRATDSAFRFFVNSTVGLAGLWDPAEHVGVPKHREDFGQTLAVWGVPSGPYMVLPFLGPSNPRDATARWLDVVFVPLTWTEFAGDPNLDSYIAGSSAVLSGLNARIEFDDELTQLNEQPEPYIALKRFYSSQRQAEIRNGKIDEDTAYDDLPDFDEFE